MTWGRLGKVYTNGEVITRQGEQGRSMFVVQSGEVEVVIDEGDRELRLSTLQKGDVFGEMALFTGSPRSATVRAVGEARVLTVDRRGFLRRVHEDPSVAFRILQKLSERVALLDDEVVRLRASSRRKESAEEGER